MPAKDESQMTTGNHDKKIMYLISGVVLLSVFLIGLGAGNMHNRNITNHSYLVGGSGMMGRHMNGDRFGAGSSASIGSDRISGVVTAVNGATLSVAGHGSSYQVQTTSTTAYKNGSSLKVNDSITALGTTNNGVLTATEIVVNP